MKIRRIFCFMQIWIGLLNALKIGIHFELICDDGGGGVSYVLEMGGHCSHLCQYQWFNCPHTYVSTARPIEKQWRKIAKSSFRFSPLSFRIVHSKANGMSVHVECLHEHKLVKSRSQAQVQCDLKCKLAIQIIDKIKRNEHSNAKCSA